MAKAEGRSQPVETLTKTTTGGNRWVIILALWVPLVFMLVLVSLAFRGQHIRDVDAQWVLHTVQVKDRVDHLHDLIEDVETSERGYLLTGDASYLEFYEKALDEIPGQNQSLALLIADNPRQVAVAANLQSLIADKLSVAAQSLSLAQQGRVPEAIQIVKNGQGKRLMDEIRSQVAAMEAEEDRLLTLRERALTSQVKSQKSEMIGLVSVEIALILGLTLLMQSLRKSQRTTDGRIEEAHAMTDHAQASTLKAIFRTKQAEVSSGEAKARTEQAEATTTLLQTCIAHLKDIVLITEAGSMEEPGPRIVFANEAFERMTGYTQDETLGRSPRFLQGEKTDRRVLDEIHQAVAEEKPIRRQIINYRKDGSEFRLDMDIVPVFDAAGKCTHFVGIERDVTEQFQAEEALRESDAKFRMLFESANDAIYIMQDGVFVDCNAKGVELFGGTRDQIMGQSPAFFSPPAQPDGRNSQEKVIENVQRAMAGKPQFFEWMQQRPDGTAVYVDVSLSRFDLRGVPYLQAIARDITERKRNNARFHRLVDSNIQGVMFWNKNGTITGANDAFLHMVRYTREDLEAGRMIWTAMTPPEFADLDRRSLADIAANGVGSLYEKEFICKDGVRVPVLIGGASFEDNPEEGVAFALDLTERKCAAEQIAEQAALLDEAQDAIIVRDLEGKVIFWNKGAERMYGWTRQEVVGLNVSRLLFPNPKQFAEINALTIAQGKWSGDLQHLTKDIRVITIEARWTLIRDDEGQPKSVLAINTDITEKKKIEAQFMRAQRMESIGTLAGGVAHDLNNILAPIMMSIDILKTTPDGPDKMMILETIEVSAKRGADIVRQVLSFARGLDGERVEIQPAHLLRDIQSIIGNTFPKNIRLQFAVPNDTWVILGDPTQVHQILLNLCVNARDAMPNGGHLAIDVANCIIDEHYAAMHIDAKVGRYVNIRVTDSGTGIPQGILDKIFEPFFTTKEVNEGTGLGLSTVMAIVKSHQGTIDVYSEPGKGTMFNVYLPALELSPEAQKLLTQQISMPKGNGETVLVVDDEASILTITSRTLQAFGYEVLTATDGAEAVAVYAEHKSRIAVILTDMSMPIMDGAAVVHALRKINPAVKIIAVSGLSSNGEVAKVSGLAIKHFLTKPYTSGTLLKVMRAILDEV